MADISESLVNQQVRAFARWLELRSFGLNCEQLNLTIGLRTAVVVAVPLMLILATHQTQYGWSVFAAFWACMTDSGGPKKVLRRYLFAFVLEGTVVAFIASYCSGLGSVSAFIIGPVLVLLCSAMPFQKLATPLTANLLCIVAVVAVSYPRTVSGAGSIAMAFFIGSLWANFVTQFVWPSDNWKPAQRSLAAVMDRLSDMVENLLKTRQEWDPLHNWHDVQTQHRCAIRIAIEHARAQLGFLGDEEPARLALLTEFFALEEAFFHACIALDFLYMSGTCTATEREYAARAVHSMLQRVKTILTAQDERAIVIAEQIKALRHAASIVEEDPACVVLAFATALKNYNEFPARSIADARLPVNAPVPPKLSPVLINAGRTAASVALVYSVAHYFHFGYPYWATMAVVVVMQPAIHITWSRSIERILGSVLGGLVAMLVFTLFTNPVALGVCAILAATINMAVRPVNYSLFVTFLTLMFVIVIELLQSGSGVASARIIDNVVGSGVSILAVVLFWPNRGKRISELIGDELLANCRYAEAIRQNDIDNVFATRRAAGLASIEAETALYAMGGLNVWRHGFSEADADALLRSRLLAGEAALHWHKSYGKS